MDSEFLRETELYVDGSGKSPVREQLARIRKSDKRGAYTIQTRIDMLRRQTLEQALRSGLIKKPTATIYVLRVQSGPVSFRLPFFEPLCRGGRLIVFTHCEKRTHLVGSGYRALIEEAERRRQDWIARNCT